MDLQLIVAILLGVGAVASLLSRFTALRRGRKPQGSCPLCNACNSHEQAESGSLETLMERPARPRR